jgi:hypothetical protein
MNRSSIATGGLLLVAAVVLPGFVNYLLTEVVSATLGTVQFGGTTLLVTTDLIGSAIWTMGYLGGVVLVWYLYIRPLDIRGPDETDLPEDR